MLFSYISQQKIPRKSYANIFLGQDLDPDILVSRIRTNSVRIGNTGFTFWTLQEWAGPDLAGWWVAV
jgi:hypothetical protein